MLRDSTYRSTHNSNADGIAHAYTYGGSNCAYLSANFSAYSCPNQRTDIGTNSGADCCADGSANSANSSTNCTTNSITNHCSAYCWPNR